MKVLIVEDDPDIQAILHMVLTKMGACQVAMTFQGSDAHLLAQENQPDFVLLDVMLPEVSGFEICKQLKTDPKTKAIPVIFLTAYATIEDSQKGLSLGAIGYLTKPFEPMTLIEKLNGLLKTTGLHLGRT